MNWKPGDRALVADGATSQDGLEHWRGQEVVLIRASWADDGYWDVDDSTAIHERGLRPIYDGNEKTSWENCIWSPLTVLAGQSND